MITLATIAFALLIDRLGLVVAMIVSMTLAALGTPETRWREYALFAVHHARDRRRPCSSTASACRSRCLPKELSWR